MKTYSILVITLILSACGGGGGGSSGGSSSNGSVNPSGATSYPVAQAMKLARSNGLQQTLTVKGSAVDNGTSYAVTGNATYTLGAESTTTFNGSAALQIPTSFNGSITVAGQTVPFDGTSTAYATPSGQPLASVSNNNYCVIQTFNPLPQTATVGETGTLGNYDCYTDSTMSSLIGTATSSYVTTAGTQGDLNLEVMTNVFNTSNALTSEDTFTISVSPNGIPTIVGFVIYAQVNGVTVNLTGQ